MCVCDWGGTRNLGCIQVTFTFKCAYISIYWERCLPLFLFATVMYADCLKCRSCISILSHNIATILFSSSSSHSPDLFSVFFHSPIVSNLSLLLQTLYKEQNSFHLSFLESVGLRRKLQSPNKTLTGFNHRKNHAKKGVI